MTRFSSVSFFYRKKIAARKLIERYYFQLTDGCGNQSCKNENCASCQKAPKLDPDEAAARAIQLFKSKAKLCVPPCPDVDSTSEENYRMDMPNGTSEMPTRNIAATESYQNCSKDSSEQKNVLDVDSFKMDTDACESSQSSRKMLLSPTENASCKNLSNSCMPMDTSKETSSQGMLHFDKGMLFLDIKLKKKYLS